jgi:hypothetical protein
MSLTHTRRDPMQQKSRNPQKSATKGEIPKRQLSINQNLISTLKQRQQVGDSIGEPKVLVYVVFGISNVLYTSHVSCIHESCLLSPSIRGIWHIKRQLSNDFVWWQMISLVNADYRC